MPKMRTFQSHANARRRLEESLKQRRRLELGDLLQYLEDVSSEPGGEEAYALALSLRCLAIPTEMLFRMLMEIRQRLSDVRAVGDAHHSIQEHLDSAAKFLDIRLSQEQERSKRGQPAPQIDQIIENQRRPSESDSKHHDDLELAAAREYGYAICRSLRVSYKWHLFHNLAALALYWTCFKPSSHPSSDATPWVEEDVIRMFP